MSDRDAIGGPNRDDEINAARLLLAKLGVTPWDLLDQPVEPPADVTFADFVPRVAHAVNAGTRRAYRTYWHRVVAAWGRDSSPR